jgi:hypothetical protein
MTIERCVLATAEREGLGAVELTKRTGLVVSIKAVSLVRLDRMERNSRIYTWREYTHCSASTGFQPSLIGMSMW